MLGETPTHEFMHAIHYYTKFNDQLQEFHRARVLKSGDASPSDLGEKYKYMKRCREFYFPPPGGADSYAAAYMYKGYATGRNEIKPRAETAQFSETVTVLHETPFYPHNKLPETTIEVLSDMPLLKRHPGLLE